MAFFLCPLTPGLSISQASLLEDRKQDLGVTSTGCVTLSMLLAFSEPYAPHLKHKDKLSKKCGKDWVTGWWWASGHWFTLLRLCS